MTDDSGAISEWVGVHRDVTDIREAEQRLQRNAETFAALVRMNPFGMYVVDADFRLVLIGQGAAAAFSTVPDAEGRDFAEIMRTMWPAAFAEDVIARFRHTLETGEPYSSPRTIEQRADIEAREAYDWHIARVTMPDGRYGVVCHFYDLSEREQLMRELSAARAAAQRNARELEALYAEAPLGIGMLDRELRFVRVNAALAEMNGFPIEEHVGKPVWDLVPDLRETAEPALRHVLETGQPLRDVTVTGTTSAQPDVEREWNEQFYPLRDAAGAISGVGIVCSEVTEQRRQERALRDSEDELRRVLDQLFAFVGILTPDGTVTYANRPPLDAAGLALESVVGQPFADAPWWSYDRAVQAQLRDAIARAARGEVVRYDVPVRLGSNLATIDFQLSPLRDRQGAITGLIPSGTVIDERIRAEQALRVLTEQLEVQVDRRTAALNAANARLTEEIARREAAQEALVRSQKLEAMGRLVAGVSHDFNNILAAVLSGLTLIEKKTDDPMALELIEMSASAARRGAGLIKQLLAFAHQQPLSPERIEIAAFFEEFRPLIEVSLPHDILLDVTVAPGCPAVSADAAQLQSALLNLAINARDAMPKGGKLQIHADAVDKDCVAITLTDNGTGMTPEVLARVAEPFFTTKDVGKGTGLGVSMVHGFATKSGGRLEITSTVGIGTTVSVVLPAADAAGGPGAEPEGDGARSEAPARILMVDDDRDFRGLAAATLIELGHDVVAVDNATSALVLLESGRFDMLMTDIAMPEVDGLELGRRVGRAHPHLPVLYMTGHADREALGDRPVLRKPFSISDLGRAIANVREAVAG